MCQMSGQTTNTDPHQEISTSQTLLRHDHTNWHALDRQKHRQIHHSCSKAVTPKHTKTGNQTPRLVTRQTDSQTDSHTAKKAGSQTASQADRHLDRETNRQTAGQTGQVSRQGSTQTDLKCNWKGQSAVAVPAAPMTKGTMCALATSLSYKRAMHFVRIRTMCLQIRMQEASQGGKRNVGGRGGGGGGGGPARGEART